MNRVIIAAIFILLIAVNWLTFHDLFEHHSLRDWMILAASVLIFVYFIQVPLRKRYRK